MASRHLKQTIDREVPERLQSRALEAFPDYEPYQAVVAYIRQRQLTGIFFFDEEGERCIYRSGYEYYKDKSERGPNWYIVSDKDKNYHVQRFKLPMEEIDLPKETSLSAKVAHPSELGWNLPITHERHLLSFPQEIVERILEWALVPGSAAVQPHMLTCNWKTESFPQGYGIQQINKSYQPCNTGLGTSIVFTKRYDKAGSYNELQIVSRAAIDATCLRTCKFFRDMGMTMLYSKNTFHFGMCNTTFYPCPPALLPNGQLYRPNPDCRYCWHHNMYHRIEHIVRAGIPDIENQVAPISLRHWIYYDPFLRSLHAIGPKKLTRINSLSFSGVAKHHYCLRDGFCKGKCDDDLVGSLSVYIRVIAALLPHLEKLRIYAKSDHYQISHTEEYEYGPKGFSIEQRFAPLLENDLRTLESLRVLEVLDSKGEKLPFAEPTMVWFAERAAKRVHEKMVADITEQEAAIARQKLLCCGFCGEHHTWAECYNLCNFCGGFGHFRKTCPTFLSQ